MRTQSLLRATFNIGRTPLSQLPPTFLLPCGASLHQAAASSSTQFQSTHSEIPPQPASDPLGEVTDPDVHGATGKPTSLSRPRASEPCARFVDDPAAITLGRPQPRLSYPLRRAAPPTGSAPLSSKPLVLSKSLQTLLPLLETQKPHYISAHVHRFPYLLTPGDTVRLPFHMHGVNPGDVLRLNRASLLGSRDYTLKAGTTSTESYDGRRTGEPNYLDERLFECRVRVLGLDSGPMMMKEKTKRRQRRVKTVRSKHKFTMLKVMEVTVNSLEKLRRDAEQLILQ